MMKKRAMVLVLGLGLAAPALAASGLGVEAHDAAGASGVFSFTISNDGMRPLSGLRWYPAEGYVVQCAAETAGGRGFSPGSTLQAGDRAECLLLAANTALPPARSAAVVVLAREADGSTSVRHAGMSLLGVATPDQGVVVVVGGAVHADGNLDGQLDAGETIAYDYTLVNAGTQALSGLAVTDLAGAVTCPAATLAVDAAMTCTRSYTVTAADAAAGFVLDQVDVTGSAANAQPVQAGDVIVTTDFGGSAGIRVFKSPLLLDDADGSGAATPGDVLGYTFLVKNSNGQSLVSVNLVEPDPSLIDGAISCEAATLVGGQAFAGLGSGTLASQDVLRCRAQHTVTAAEGADGEALNLAEASGLAAIGGPVSGTGASAVAVANGTAQLVLTKTASAGFVLQGGRITYTITVSNSGNTDIQNVTISDPVPEGLEAFSWTCSGSGVACPAASGGGAISAMLPVFPAGAQLVYTVGAIVSAGAPSPIVNTVTATPPEFVRCLPSDQPPPCLATAPVATAAPVPVPLGGGWKLAVLMLMLAFTGVAALSVREAKPAR